MNKNWFFVFSTIGGGLAFLINKFWFVDEIELLINQASSLVIVLVSILLLIIAIILLTYDDEYDDWEFDYIKLSLISFFGLFIIFSCFIISIKGLSDVKNRVKDIKENKKLYENVLNPFPYSACDCLNDLEVVIDRWVYLTKKYELLIESPNYTIVEKGNKKIPFKRWEEIQYCIDKFKGLEKSFRNFQQKNDFQNGVGEDITCTNASWKDINIKLDYYNIPFYK